jgi:hypothetical protein
MDIFKPFLGQGEVPVRYRDGVVAWVEILPTPLGSGYEGTLPYTVTPPRLIHKEHEEGLFRLYAANGNCYYRGNADIISIEKVEQMADIFKPFVGKKVLVTFQGGDYPFLVDVRTSLVSEFPYVLEDDPNLYVLCNQTGLCFNGQTVVSVREIDQYKNVLKGLAEILLSYGPDDDDSDLREEILEHMRTNCKDIMDEVKNKQDREVEQLRD